MQLRSKLAAFAGATLALPAALNAQFSFPIRGREVQIHSFVSQGFGYSDHNNYLTMKTSRGSLAMTDFGVNVSSQITDKFRVGAQLYDRNLGNLGNWHPTVDWAFGDYQFKSWLGVRAGKVKTTLGLYNDTQDMEFLHTWAILPQSAYPLDLRASTIAHTGADLYGTFSLKERGDISYTGYVGTRSPDKYGGYRYGLKPIGMDYSKESGWHTGGDLRWNNLVKGVLFGASFLHNPGNGIGTIQLAPGLTLPFESPTTSQHTAFYVEYRTGNLTINGEYRRELIKGTEYIGGLPYADYEFDQRGWYASASYRICRRLELGTYHSRFYPLWDQDHARPDNHIFDYVAAGKINLTHQWDLKIEGHFMDGYGLYYALRGFYPQDNPQGLHPKTNLLIVRTGWTF